MTGAPTFDFEVLVVQSGVVLWSRMVSSADKQSVVEVCPRDFGPPRAGTGSALEVVVTGLRDQNCGCGE